MSSSPQKYRKKETQNISQTERTMILTLHHYRLGWLHILECMTRDRKVGFPCEVEESIARKELNKASQNVFNWFKDILCHYNLPSPDKQAWEVDFESSQLIPKKQDNKTKLKKCDIENELIKFQDKPLMYLGPTDCDIIRSLLEKREAFTDLARPLLCHIYEDDFSTDKLNSIVQQVGAAEHNMRDWFFHMATKYRWPQVGNLGWRYQLDLPEQLIYLTYES